jgi:lipoprotein NlpD
VRVHVGEPRAGRRPQRGHGSGRARSTALLPGAENAGKPGYYTVRAGDTMKIATEVGQPWRDIVGWNKLDNPNAIEVGQVLRVVPPVGSASPQAVPAPVEAARGGAAHSAGGKPAPVPVATQTTPGAATPAPVPASAAAAPRQRPRPPPLLRRRRPRHLRRRRQAPTTSSSSGRPRAR